MAESLNDPSRDELLESLSCPPPEVTVDDVQRLAASEFGLSGEAGPLGGERDRNFLLRTGARQVLLKVANASESDALLDCQCRALAHISRLAPALPVQRLIRTLDDRDWAAMSAASHSPLRVRAFEFLPGILLKDAGADPRLMRNVGAVLAKLGRALRGFNHAASDHPLAWDLKRFSLLSGLLPAVPGSQEQDIIAWVIERFHSQVQPELEGLRAQVIHNDVSYHNVVVDPGSPFEVSGIFDFGDLIHAPLIQDLAVTAAEVPASRSDPLARCAEIVAGYNAGTVLEDIEIHLLPDLIATRLALGVLVDCWSSSQLDWQDDRPHLANWRASSFEMLEQIVDMGAGDMETLFRSACGRAPPLSSEQDPSMETEGLMRRRLACLGNGKYFSYARPVHTVRGQGVWLYDAEGRAYLDAYNNVPHVGHCHPRVVGAVARQTATLNTNTRYLYDAIVSYAERLTSTLPDGLDVCYFVSSGSEANDLAWQLARVWTNNDGGLIIEHAYHGVTDAVFHLSPSGRQSAQSAAHIATLPAPDDYRGEWKREVEDRGRRYAAHCDQAIKRLQRNGHGPAAFFIDMIMSTNGIIVPPPGYLEDVFARVRAAGGLCVADEVQSGFGRLGKVMWGFQTGNVVPDIVTFGKPIANGYPMGLVVTTRAIADRFEEYAEYFSTTGGNPVACASALAVLDVLEEENLMCNADQVGTRVFHGIEELANKFDIIGDVRGSGLFMGLELVEDRASLEPASEKTRAVVDTLRDLGVLVGIDGPHDNVIKIRPPMVFNETHADRLLQCLEKALTML